jgi:hypothetical protein
LSQYVLLMLSDIEGGVDEHHLLIRRGLIEGLEGSLCFGGEVGEHLVNQSWLGPA